MRILTRGAALAAAVSMLAAWALAAEAVKGPCVAFPSGTTSGSAVIWWEAQAAGEGWVKYDAGGGQKLAKCGMPGPRHEVTIPGLKPGSTVRYEIGGSGVSDSGSFRAPDPKQTKMRFAVIGDPRA